MVRKNIQLLRSEFREDRGQTTAPPKIETAPPSRERRKTRTPYEGFLVKYKDLENRIDDLGTRDLVYYFREVAQDSGYHYTIANIKKDMAIMKRLQENYSVREICGMIEFLYESEQDYLQKDRLSPNLLASQWVNTIYADMQLWVEDKYVPNSVQQKKKLRVKQREWDSSETNSADSNIGIKL